jgi:hypothetical protein
VSGVADGDPGALPDGAVDVHVHTAPDLVERYQSDVELGRAARAADMAGIVVKSHVLPTVGRVDLVNEVLCEDVLYGGVALNGGVGGLNVDAARTALELGARIVWLPTAWSANHASQARAAGVDRFVGQRVPGPDEELPVARDGEVTARTQRIVDLVAEYDAALGTGHASPAAIDAVVDACADAGVTPLVNHPCFGVVDVPIDQQVSLAERGAVMEYCAYSVRSTDGHTVERVVEAVERVGAEHCLLATDFGQADNPPVPGLAAFLEGVVEAGLSRDTANRLVTDTPSRVLGLGD